MQANTKITTPVKSPHHAMLQAAYAEKLAAWKAEHCPCVGEEKIRVYYQQYHETHKEHIRESQRAWRQRRKNRDNKEMQNDE